MKTGKERFIEIWASNCGAPKAVFVGHLEAMLEEERMSALEKAMRERAERCAGYSGGMDKEADGAAKGYAEAADLVAQRDAQLRGLLYDMEHYPGGEWSRRLRFILEGKAE